MEEIWKPVENYETLYEISNYGRVKSVKTIPLILQPVINSNGYLNVGLHKNQTFKMTKIHILVWDAFGDKPRNGRILQVDHRDENKQNNHINNLQLLTNRENVSKGALQNKNKTSKYTGVSLCRLTNKWRATIMLNGKRKQLGRFNCETAAMVTYCRALRGINGY